MLTQFQQGDLGDGQSPNISVSRESSHALLFSRPTDLGYSINILICFYFLYLTQFSIIILIAVDVRGHYVSNKWGESIGTDMYLISSKLYFIFESS